ncbi:hypothetical protein DFS34DRAFT_647049 [Phlyctochytrium arcticum]|nr:hypothetical protein DFS34DRAFT_647049 [Phlyctochytrium arcticum]
MTHLTKCRWFSRCMTLFLLLAPILLSWAPTASAQLLPAIPPIPTIPAPMGSRTVVGQVLGIGGGSNGKGKGKGKGNGNDKETLSTPLPTPTTPTVVIAGNTIPIPAPPTPPPPATPPLPPLPATPPPPPGASTEPTIPSAPTAVVIYSSSSIPNLPSPIVVVSTVILPVITPIISPTPVGLPSSPTPNETEKPSVPANDPPAQTTIPIAAPTSRESMTTEPSYVSPKKSPVFRILAIVIPLVGIALVILAIVCIRKRRNRKSRVSQLATAPPPTDQSSLTRPVYALDQGAPFDPRLSKIASDIESQAETGSSRSNSFMAIPIAFLQRNRSLFRRVPTINTLRKSEKDDSLNSAAVSTFLSPGSPLSQRSTLASIDGSESLPIYPHYSSSGIDEKRLSGLPGLSAVSFFAPSGVSKDHISVDFVQPPGNHTLSRAYMDNSMRTGGLASPATDPLPPVRVAVPVVRPPSAKSAFGSIVSKYKSRAGSIATSSGFGSNRSRSSLGKGLRSVASRSPTSHSRTTMLTSISFATSSTRWTTNGSSHEYTNASILYPVVEPSSDGTQTSNVGDDGLQSPDVALPDEEEDAVTA